MITAFMLSSVVGFVNIMFSWLPAVDALPSIAGFDIDGNMQYVMSILNGLRDALPPFDTLMSALLWYYGILMVFLTWSVVRWIIGLIRGSGS